MAVSARRTCRVPAGRGTLDAVQTRLEAVGPAVEAGWDRRGDNRAVYPNDRDGDAVEPTEQTMFWDDLPATAEGPLSQCDWRYYLLVVYKLLSTLV